MPSPGIESGTLHMSAQSTTRPLEHKRKLGFIPYGDTIFKTYNYNVKVDGNFNKSPKLYNRLAIIDSYLS